MLRASVLSLTLSATFVLASCAGSAGPAHQEEHAVNYTPTAADLEFVKSDKPVAGARAVLYVNGLGCPLCASNIDQQLLRVRGVDKVKTDLSVGRVTVDLAAGKQPSPSLLAEAVEDAGFTLVKIESN